MRIAVALILAMAPFPVRGDHADEATAIEAGESDAEEPRRRLIKWNEYDGPVSTIHFGLGFIFDYAAYAQDHESKQQLTMDPDAGVRDFRFLVKGRFKTERPLTWMLGYMYDKADSSWHFRQTGLMIGFPELHGSLFIGRTKEGYSLDRIMTGYHIVAMERAPALEAFVPILADGLKWTGYFSGPEVFFNLGLYTDWLSEDEKFATYDLQIVARVGWLP